MTSPRVDSSATAGREEKSSSLNLKRVVIFAAAGLLGAIVLLFILAVVLALTTNLEQSGAVIRLIRDLVIIFLVLEGVLIIFALAILILQVAKLINLLQTEVKPILENTQETVKTAQGTVKFVSENALAPIVRVSSFFAGVSVLLRELFGLRRALQSTDKEADRDAA